MKKEHKFSGSLSALILLAFGVIWLIYVCAGNQMPETTANGITAALAIIAFVAYLVLIFSDYHDLPSVIVWLMIIATICMLPAVIISVVSWFGVDLTVYPVFAIIANISGGFSYIYLYIFLITRACGITDSFLFRLLFIAIGLFLIFGVVVGWIPALAEIIPVPLIRI